MGILNATFQNVTTESPSFPNDLLGPEYHRMARVIIIAAMIFFSLTGNCLVCFRLSRNHRSAKGQILFLNLSVADLSVTFFTMTSQLVWEVMGRRWIAGDIFCRIFKVLQTLGLVSSTYVLVAIAIDRYFAIVKPLAQSPQPWKLAMGAWIASLLPSLPNIYFFREVYVAPNLCYCTSIFYSEYWPAFRQVYMALVLFSIFIIPFLLLVVLYTRILIEMSRQASILLDRTFTSIPRAKMKTIKLALVIFSAFIITNLPYGIQEMIIAFGDPNSLNPNVVTLFGVISASNSALNPFIYLTFHAKWECWSRCCAFVKDSWMRGSKRTPTDLHSRRATLTSSTAGSRHLIHVRTNAVVTLGATLKKDTDFKS